MILQQNVIEPAVLEKVRSTHVATSHKNLCHIHLQDSNTAFTVNLSNDDFRSLKTHACSIKA